MTSSKRRAILWSGSAERMDEKWNDSEGFPFYSNAMIPNLRKIKI